MADDLKISEMVEILSGDLHDDLAFEVIDLLEPLVEDQNKKVKLVTLEASFGSEDKIFKDTTVVQAWGDTDPDAVTMDMYESDNDAVLRFFDAQGQNSRLDIGGMGVPGIFMRFGIGSDPDIRAMSGTDTWMLLEPDRQQLGNSAAGNAFLRVNPNTPNVEAWANSVEVLDLAELIQRLGVTAQERIEINQTNDTIQAYVEEGDVGGNQLVFDIDGQNSRINLGRITELHARQGTGSDPTFRVMSGTDEWLHIHGDQQRLGAGSGSDSHVRVTSGGVEGVVAGTNQLNLTTLLQRIGAAADTNIEINQTNNTVIAEIANAIRFELNNNHGLIGNQAALRLDVDWGDDKDIKAYDENNVQNLHLTTNVQEIGTLGDTYIHFDQATGIFTFRCDNNIEATLGPTGLTLSAGATVDNIETTLTDDDTHIPTSGAVFDALGGAQPGALYFGGNARATAKTDGIEIEGPSAQILHIDAATGTFSIETQGSIHLRLATGGENAIRCYYNGGVWLYYDAIKEAETVSGALQITNALQLTSGGNLINEFETALTNDANKVPTSSAVFAAIGAATKLEVLNTKVEVSDTGADGLVNIVADGFQLLKAENGKIYIGGTDGNFFTMAHDAGHVYMNNPFVNGDWHIQGTITGPTVHNMISMRPDGGIDLRYNNVIKTTIGADTLELKGDQTGAEAIGNAATTVAITFGTAHADANYQVLATVENTTDGGPLVLAAIITAKATTGFTATLSAATDSANYVLNWLAIRS
jgi:hypothetical protein